MSDSTSETPLPERDEAYGARVWATPRAESCAREFEAARASRWLLVPALATFAGAVFAAGMWTERARSAPIVLTGRLPIATVTFPQPSVVVRATPKKPARKSPKPRFAPSDTDQDQKPLAFNTRLSENQPAAMPELLDMVTDPTSDKTKEHALIVLAQSDTPEVGSDTNGSVRRAVLKALAAQQKVAALSALAREETDLRQKVEILRWLDSPTPISPAR